MLNAVKHPPMVLPQLFLRTIQRGDSSQARNDAVCKLYFVGNALERSDCGAVKLMAVGSAAPGAPLAGLLPEVTLHGGTVKTVPYVQTMRFIVIS